MSSNLETFAIRPQAAPGGGAVTSPRPATRDAEVVSEASATGELTFLTWSAGAHGSLREATEGAYETILETLASQDAVVLQERVFGRAEAARRVLQTREEVWRRKGAPPAAVPTFVEGVPFGSRDLVGVHVIAARGQRGHGRLLASHGQVCGRVVTTGTAEFLALSDVGRLVRGRALRSDAETREILRTALDLLANEGWTFGDVGRTWFYLRELLDWYGSFNRVRNEEFQRMGLLGGELQGRIPASTGIEGRNAFGGWCTLDLLAARPTNGGAFEMRRLSNVRQSEATEYGSAFARGVALTVGDFRYVFVSGTASIDDHGASVHEGDFEAQTRRTFETVEALLAGAGAGMSHVQQATAFVKHPHDARAYERLANAVGFAVPPLAMVADVCRSELLFELDATAVVPLAPGDPGVRGAA
jgi:enamine deaminase RidA (YjgF/YER057c/UK114 family)